MADNARKLSDELIVSKATMGGLLNLGGFGRGEHDLLPGIYEFKGIKDTEFDGTTKIEYDFKNPDLEGNRKVRLKYLNKTTGVMVGITLAQLAFTRTTDAVDAAKFEAGYEKALADATAAGTSVFKRDLEKSEESDFCAGNVSSYMEDAYKDDEDNGALPESFEVVGFKTAVRVVKDPASGTKSEVEMYPATSYQLFQDAWDSEQEKDGQPIKNADQTARKDDDGNDMIYEASMLTLFNDRKLMNSLPGTNKHGDYADTPTRVDMYVRPIS